MSTLFLPESRLADILNQLMKTYQVIAPQLHGDIIEYSVLQKVTDLNLDFIRTRNGIKRYVFPQTETVFSTEIENDKYSVKVAEEDPTQKIVFGARSCDSQAIHQQAMVFNKKVTDSLFNGKRSRILLIVLNCVQPGEFCFCESMGTGPFATDGYDIEFTPIPEGYLVESRTKEGAQLLENTRQLFDLASADQQNEKQLQYTNTIQKFSRHYEVSKIQMITNPDFYHPVWDELGASCIECGGCVYACPTCTCFNLVDTKYISSKGIEETRIWDTCLFSSFSRMAGNINPRKTLGEKYRQRTLKKLNFTKLWYQCHHCVGCGRCIESCPGDIGIDKGIQTMIKLSEEAQKQESTVVTEGEP